MRLAVFEDDKVENLSPLSLARPVFELVCGQFSLRERLIRRFDVTDWGVFLRPYLADVYADYHHEAHVNDCDWLREAPTLLINGRWLPTLKALANIQTDQVGIIENEIAYITLDTNEAPQNWDEDRLDVLGRIAKVRKSVSVDGKLIRHPWDLTAWNATQLRDDFRLRQYGRSHSELSPHVSLLGNVDEIHIDPLASIEPFVVIDARQGPVTIEAGTVIESFTRLEGPCHIGMGTRLLRAVVRGGSTIGPVCRVGGEIDASIIHGYANKSHDGFLGHSYVCPWVNLGAMTTSSNLKNNYSSVSVPINGEMVDSGLNKVGCFIGDHSKTAIGSLFNTGTNMGVMSMAIPSGGLLTRDIPSFCRVWKGELQPQSDLDDLIGTAKIVMQRRNIDMKDSEERLLRELFDLTENVRREAVEKSARRAKSVLKP